jgi:hypothetical protein
LTSAPDITPVSTMTQAPSTLQQPSPTSTIVDAANVLDLEKDPLILFGAVPPMPSGAILPLPQGSADYFDLFSPEADWTAAATHVDVFKLHTWQVRQFLSDDQPGQILWVAGGQQHPRTRGPSADQRCGEVEPGTRLRGAEAPPKTVSLASRISR